MAESLRKKSSSITDALAKADSRLPWLKYFVFLFVYLLVYSVAIVCHGHFWILKGTCYTYHIVDFDFGFCTKLIVGEVFRRIFGNPTFKEVYVTESVLIIIAFAVICGLLSRLLVSVKDSKTRFALLVLCVFFLSGPASFGGFTNQLGMLDAHWLFLAIIFIFVLENKYLRYIIPALVFLMIMVHYAAIINYIIFCCMVLLYRVSIADSKSEKRQYASIFAFSVAAAILSFLYFQFFEESNVKVTMEEMDRILIERAYPRSGDTLALRLYHFAFFREETMHRGSEYDIYVPYESIPFVNLPIPGFVNKLINILVSQVYINFNIEKEKSAKAFYIPYIFLCCLPLLVYIYSVRIKLMKSDENKLRKFCSFLALVQFPFCAAAGILMSTDITRFYMHAFIICVAYLLYTAYREENVRIAIRDAFYRLDLRLVGAYFFVFMLSTADTYI